MTAYKEVTFKIPEDEYGQIKGKLEKSHDETCALFVPVDDKLRDLVKDALMTDGAHHKQWYLERIAEKLNIDTDHMVYRDGIVP